MHASWTKNLAGEHHLKAGTSNLQT